MPTIFILFGSTGDLAQRKLLPAIFSLRETSILGEDFRIVAFGRRAFGRDEFRNIVRRNRTDYRGVDSTFDRFIDHIEYIEGKFEDDESFRRLAKFLAVLDQGFGVCSNKVFHLAVAPLYLEPILTRMYSSGLVLSCSDGRGKTRLLLEKPFGRSGEDASRLHGKVGTLFSSADDVFHIDHYLMKDAISRLVRFRSRPNVEKIWHSGYISRIEVRLYEKKGVAGRGTFYESVGGLRDIFQNHLLEVLAMVCMENTGRTEFPGKRVLFLKNLSLSKNSEPMQAQYKGFSEDVGIATSQTETFFRVPLESADPRWRGVEIVAEGGKALASDDVSVSVEFSKGVKFVLNNQNRRVGKIVFHIQPDILIELCDAPETVGTMALCVLNSFDEHGIVSESPVENYARVYAEVLADSHALFPSFEEVRETWRITDSVRERLARTPLLRYHPGEFPD